jgi:hypothetical protein
VKGLILIFWLNHTIEKYLNCQIRLFF